jgi:ribosomal protein S18 acetylase RimI-like enzyme
MEIKPFDVGKLDSVVELSLRAWAPVFVSIEKTYLPAVYKSFYPKGWHVAQEEAVKSVCVSEDNHVWVAEDAGKVVGFVAVSLHVEDCMGEVYMIAVDPDAQRQGIALALTDFAVNYMKQAGMKIAMVETGADSSHAPARSTYEKAGFTLHPVARYFKEL